MLKSGMCYTVPTSINLFCITTIRTNIISHFNVKQILNSIVKCRYM